ncbi:MAG: SNF2-related protein [Nanoarchaeota archaeon]
MFRIKFVKQKNETLLIKGLRLSDINILKEIYSSKVKNYFIYQNRLLFSMRYEIPKSMALDLYLIFLGAYQNTTGYYKLRFKNAIKSILKETWVGEVFNNPSSSSINFKKLENKLTIKLLPYQKKFIKEYFDNKNNRNLRGYFLAFDQGLGKTVTALALSMLLKNRYNVIVCPNNLKMVWAKEITKVIKGYQNKEDFYKQVYVQNASAKFDPKNCKYIIVNFKSFKKILKYLNKKDGITMIVDESHNIKDFKSVRFKEIFKFTNEYNVTDCLLQSGTPIKGSATELIHIFLLLEKDLGKPAIEIYRKVLTTEDKNLLNIINNKFKFMSHRKTKLDVQKHIKLPEKVFHTEYIKLPNQSQYELSSVKKEMNAYIMALYEAEKFHLEEYRKIVDKLIKKYSTFDSYITDNISGYKSLIKKIRKGGLLDEEEKEFKSNFEKNISIVMNNKDKKQFRFYVGKANSLYNSCVGRAVGNVYMKKYREMVNDIAKYSKDLFKKIYKKSKTKKLVILTSYPEAAYTCEKMLSSMNLNSVVITGGTNNKDRLKNLKSFSEDPNIHALIGTTNILYVGFTFIESDSLVFLNQPWRDTDRQQAADRIHRIGQVNVTKIYEILLEGDDKTLSSRNNEIIQNSKKIF